MALLLLIVGGPAAAQTTESTGTRALGMGGAFVAVANDSSATWWNPAGIAAGPFLDFGGGHATTSVDERVPARRDTVSGIAFATPPFGLSYYRVRVTAAGPSATGEGAQGRNDEGGGTPVRSLTVRQIGGTVVHTLFTGVHAGATLKYLSGTVREGHAAGSLEPADLLDAGDDLDGGDADSEFDLDIGVHATVGAVSIGAVVRNVLEPEFGGAAGLTAMHLPRQVRLGASFDGDRLGSLPLTLAIDADLHRYATGTGDRRVVAVGAEQWFLSRRLALRGGARFNTAGAEDRTATGGVSVALRSGLYLDGFAAAGGDAAEQGWGVTVRVSF